MVRVSGAWRLQGDLVSSSHLQAGLERAVVLQGSYWRRVSGGEYSGRSILVCDELDHWRIL